MEETIQDKRQFYQSKYEYYRLYCLVVVLGAALASTTYWISDCELFGRIAWETLIPRMFILIPMTLYAFFHKRVNDYRIMIPFAYLILHGIMWCTIWAIYYLPIKQHANEGFIIMQVIFFALGLCAPWRYSIIAHSMLIMNIVVSNTFNHYESFVQMLLLGIPCVIGICAVGYVSEKVYMEQYLAKKELERAYKLDRLTNVYNRNILASILDERGNRLVFNPENEIYVIVTDIDHFKDVNDKFGHPEGDKILATIAEIIQEYISAEDYLIRWGGEEFVIILTDSSLEKTKEIAERIRIAVEIGEELSCPVTISMGISSYDGIDYRSAISNADKALYHAKSTGRNKVVFYDEIM